MQNNLPEIAENIQTIKTEIGKICKSASRAESEIKLIGVSKTQPKEKIIAAVESGHKVFGENRVQEAIEHWQDIDFEGRELHLIGHLQSNKAEDAVKIFDYIHTLDRESLCSALQKAIIKTGKRPKILVEVNIGAEPQKSGVNINDLSGFLKLARDTYNLEICGLMCIPPANEPVAAFFALLQKYAKQYGLKELSMGMSNDYKSAIKFGATMVRVGSAIFGERII